MGLWSILTSILDTSRAPVAETKVRVCERHHGGQLDPQEAWQCLLTGHPDKAPCNRLEPGTSRYA